LRPGRAGLRPGRAGVRASCRAPIET
jgi:hypothetical protein